MGEEKREIRFSGITGQKRAVKQLQEAMHTGHLGHAYILAGEKGLGGEDLAYTLGAAILCESPKEENGRIEPCGKCRSCIQAAAGSNPDLITVEPDREKSKTGILSVDVIRNMTGDVQIRPYESDHKVYIIKEADRMNAQAQNALLKTLEEPPAYAVILLVCEGTEAFLPTVLSRCITIRLQPAGTEEITQYLEGKGIDHERALLAAKGSHGNPGRALERAGSDGYFAFRQEVLDLLKNIRKKNAYDLTAFSQRFEKKAAGGKKKEEDTPSYTPEAGDFYDILSCYVSDLALAKSTGDAGRLIFADEVQYILEAAGRLSFRAIRAMEEAVLLAMQRRNSNVSEQQTALMCLLDLRSAVK